MPRFLTPLLSECLNAIKKFITIKYIFNEPANLIDSGFYHQSLEKFPISSASVWYGEFSDMRSSSLHMRLLDTVYM